MRLRPTGTLKNISSIIIYCIIFSTLVWVPIVSIKHNHVTHETPQAPLPTVPVETAPVASEVFTLVNTERSKAGLAPLVEDTRLDTAATAKCADMQANDYVAHIAPSGTRWDSFIRAQYSRYQEAGENLSWDYTTSQAAVNGWMGSPGHRANILNGNFTEVGYAICTVDSRYKNVIVQQFVGE